MRNARQDSADPAQGAGTLARLKPLRPIRPTDMLQLLVWDSDPELAALTGQKFPSGRDAFSWWQGLQRDPHRLGFAIEDETGNLIGDVELEHISWRSREAELRISIGDKRRWGQGYGTAALTRMLELAFERLGLETVYLRVLASNARAIRTYYKLGFRKRGRLPATGRLRHAEPLLLMAVEAAAFYGERSKACSAGLRSTSWAYGGQPPAPASMVVDRRV